MKTIMPSRKFPALATAVAIVITFVFSIRPAHAGYIVSLQQVGPDVVATGSGTLDVTGLTLNGGGGAQGHIEPDSANINVGAGPIDNYLINFGPPDNFNGPDNFGPGGPRFSDTFSGSIVAISNDAHFGVFQGELDVPQGYVSGTPLGLSTATFTGQTFSSLGVTPGIYEWTWGGAGVNQNFTLYAGVPVPAVPDSGSTFGLLILSLTGLFGAARFRSLRVA